MEEYKRLQEARQQKPVEPRKDRLEQTKKREKELKEAAHEEREAQKAAHIQEHIQEKLAGRFDRQFYGTSKRSVRDGRKAARKAMKQVGAELCEHGVWKCRICFPVAAAQSKHTKRALVDRLAVECLFD